MRSTIIIYRNASSCSYTRTASSYFCFFYSTTSSSTSTLSRKSRPQSQTWSTLKQQGTEIQSFRRFSGSQRLYSTSRISSENQDQESKQSRSKTTTSILQIIAWLPVFLFFTSHVYSIGQVHGASMSVSSAKEILSFPSLLFFIDSFLPFITFSFTLKSRVKLNQSTVSFINESPLSIQSLAFQARDFLLPSSVWIVGRLG